MGGFWASISRTFVFWIGIGTDAVRETVTDIWSTPLKFAGFVAAIIGAAVVWLGFKQAVPTYTFTAAISLLAFLGLAIIWKMLSIPARRAADFASRVALAEQSIGATQSSPSNKSEPLPDWTIKELFFHIDNDVLRDGNRERADNWIVVEQEFADAASLGRLAVWGRPFEENRTQLALERLRALEPIDPSYWRKARLTHEFYGDGDPAAVRHTDPDLMYVISEHLASYCDLRVNSAQAKKIWPRA